MASEPIDDARAGTDGSGGRPPPGELGAVELASLLSSRICHDLAGAVGAVLNGLEFIAEEGGRDVDAGALDLVKQSAEQAARRLAFARLAFGAYGGAKEIETVEVRRLAEEHFAGGRIALDWRVAPAQLPRDIAKLLLNLTAAAAGAIPRGGVLEVSVPDEPGAALTIAARSETARRPSTASVLEAGAAGEEPVDPRTVQAYLAFALARSEGRRIAIETHEGVVTFRV